VAVDDSADREDLELATEVGDDWNESARRTQGQPQDHTEKDADDAKGQGVEVGGNELRDSYERATVMEIPATDRIVPTLNRTSAMTADDHEADEDADNEDGNRYPDEESAGPDGSPRLTDLLGGCLRELR
jgi:hypothetical protein